jgi:hypothetical protein
LYHFTQLVCKDGILLTFCSDFSWISVFSISISWVTRIIGVHHQIWLHNFFVIKNSLSETIIVTHTVPGSNSLLLCRAFIETTRPCSTGCPSGSGVTVGVRGVWSLKETSAGALPFFSKIAKQIQAIGCLSD